MKRKLANCHKLILVWALLTLSLPDTAIAQSHLATTISIRARQQPLARVLQDMGKKGGFFFSYNSNILKEDSLVDLDADRKNIQQILDLLLGGRYDYSESGRYIILQRKAAPIPSSASFTISGWVVDAETKKKIGNASIYEADQLLSTMTDSSGFFRLRVRDRSVRTIIAVSKELYQDTFLIVRQATDQEYTFTLAPSKIGELTPFVVSSRVEKTWLGRFLLSSRQKMQSLNLLNFLASKPIQFSLTPGLGTHGQMGAQVVNKFSLNLLGGYTAGSNGLEMAGLFNIDKKDVHYVQVAGLANMVGGKTTGVQLAGLQNNDLDSVKGFQAAGLANRVHTVFNGVQMAGIVNVVEGKVNGVQAAGLANVSMHEMKGVQLSGIFNYTKNLKGVQIGLVNMADSSSGYMIGLLNICRYGDHALSFSANETLPVNLAYKSGSRKTYSILLAGADLRSGEKAFVLGYGIGAGFPVAPGWWIDTELTLSYFYLGSWTGMPAMYRLQPSLEWRWTKKLGLFAGPAFSLFDKNKAESSRGFKNAPPVNRFGWSIGINFL